MSEATEHVTAKPWYRRIKPWQFSLRTMLVLMAIASAACWYYLLPEQSDEDLAGGYLLLQRQFRPRKLPQVPVTGTGWAFQTQINDGYWRIKDLEGNLLVNGHYRKDYEQGWWTTYHANGRVAVQGKMRAGGRIGVWKTWSADGQLLSEATYATSKAVPSWNQVVTTSHLQGPAKFWHPNGKLAATGAFENGERNGQWEEWSEQGNPISSGEYRAGKRTGEWREYLLAGKKPAVHQYVNGLRQEQFDAELQQLATRIEQGDIAQRLTLLSVLVDYGPAALPIAEQWAGKREQPAVQLAAIIATANCGGKVDHLEPALANIVATAPQLAATARWEIYRQFPQSRQEHFQALRVESRQRANSSPLAGVDLLRQMFAVDPARRAELFEEILQIVREHLPENSRAEVRSVGPFEQTESTAGEWQATWRESAVPFLEDSLTDPKPENRLAAVLLLRQLLAERKEFARPLVSPAVLKWEIPSQLATLVARARRDSDAGVKEEADHIDEVYHGTPAAGGLGGGGGFGGGGGLF